MRTAHRLIILAAMAVSGLTSEVTEAAEFKPVWQSSTAQGDVYWWSARNVGSVFATVGTLHYGFTRNVFLDVQVGLAPSIDGPGGQSRFGLANPTIGAHYAATTSGGFTWFVGGRLSFPLGAIRDGDWQYATGTAGAAMVFWDAHLWYSYALPVGAVAGFEYRAANPVVLRAELDPEFIFPIGAPGNNPKTQFAYQGRFEVEARSDMGAGGGGALQFFHEPTQDGDNAQAGIEPFFSYDSGRFFMRAGLLIALDTPLGFGFDRGKVLTLHGMFGGHLD